MFESVMSAMIWWPGQGGVCGVQCLDAQVIVSLAAYRRCAVWIYSLRASDGGAARPQDSVLWAAMLYSCVEVAGGVLFACECGWASDAVSGSARRLGRLVCVR